MAMTRPNAKPSKVHVLNKQSWGQSAELQVLTECLCPEFCYKIEAIVTLIVYKL